MRWKLGVVAGLVAVSALGLLASSPAWSGQDEQPRRTIVDKMNQCMDAPVFFALSALDLNGDGQVTQDDLSLLGRRIAVTPPGSPPVDTAGLPEGDLADRLAALGGDDSPAMDKLRGIYDGIVPGDGGPEKRRSLQDMHDYTRILDLARRLIGCVLDRPQGTDRVAGVVLYFWDGRSESVTSVLGDQSEELVGAIMAGRPRFHRAAQNFQLWVQDSTITAAKVVQ